MTRSMTAFAREQFLLEGRSYQLEISSLNRKGFEIIFHMPREFAFLEIPFRKMLAQVCSRGHIVVKFNPGDGCKGKISIEFFKEVHKKLNSVAKSLDSKYEVTFESVLNWVSRGDFILEIDEEKMVNSSQKAMEKIIQTWIEMKNTEGNALAKDIKDRLSIIKEAVVRIAMQKENAVEKYREKLLDKINEIKTLEKDDQERVLREVVIYAEKVDITEEVTRLDSHISQIRNIIETKVDESIGKTLDFVVKEMMREANTISAKASDLTVIHDALLIKGEIEKIREQVQNIE